MPAPAVPSGIKASSPEPGTIELRWDVSSGASQYNVYGKKATGVTSAAFDITQVVTKERAKFSGLGPGKWFFTLTARNVAVEISADATEVSAATFQA